MSPLMDAPRTTISLGPIELSIRRNEEGRRIGLPGSIVVHILTLVLALLISTHTSKVAQQEKLKQEPAPIPITFVSPIPAPAVPKPPAPKPPAIDARKIPPQPTNKPLRMQPVPESS